MLSGTLAAVLAWLFNSFLIARWGKEAIWLAAPLVEESLKTGLALLLGTSLFISHLLFGLAEGIFDVLRPGRDDLPAGISGLISHGVYGWLTQTVWLASGNIWLGVAAALVVHMLWNAAVVLLARRRQH